MQITRRLFLVSCAVLGGRNSLANRFGAEGRHIGGVVRSYHVCLNPDSLEAYPDLLDVVANAGMTHVWLPAFFYGYWPYPHEKRRKWHRAIERRGMATAVINIPLGHPGDSLGAMHGNIPLAPPEHWGMGHRPDGTTFSGTSLHPPATEENAAAMRSLAEEGVSAVFLDDDFRLAVTPGIVGGCFCDSHRRRFLQSRGYKQRHWNELLDSVERREPTPVLREWVGFTCDELMDSFRQQQAAAPDVELGNMIMYFGSEKAGIRLPDYRDAPFRVGESKFSDASFSPVKGKTDALFSCLFHRRYARAEKAYSETTAFPADQLSACNMAAKLAISTIADVRNTMFMSGLTPYPIGHWSTIGPAMRHNAALHQKVAGYRPAGPLKHYWGDYSRLVGTDEPYSLFLAMGVPFEVRDTPAEEGWTFLSDADARGFEDGAFPRTGTRFVARPGAGRGEHSLIAVPESLEGLYELKREIVEQMNSSVPYVVEDVPVVCAWYPDANTVLLWNLREERLSITLRSEAVGRAVTLDALAITEVPLNL